MSKRVYIIHKWSGEPGSDWYEWLESKLEREGVEVHIPDMPYPEDMSIEASVEFLADLINKPDQQTYFVAHSLGCQAVLRYLETLDNKVGGVVFVAPWFNLKDIDTYDPEDKKVARQWVDAPMDFKKLNRNITILTALFSRDDSHVPISDEELFRHRLRAQTVIMDGMGHFTEDDLEKHKGGYKTRLHIVRDELFALMGLGE